MVVEQPALSLEVTAEIRTHEVAEPDFVQT